MLAKQEIASRTSDSSGRATQTAKFASSSVRQAECSRREGTGSADQAADACNAGREAGDVHLVDGLHIEAQVPVVDGIVLGAVVDVWYLQGTGGRERDVVTHSNKLI